MSLQVFKSDLAKCDTVDMDSLKMVWEHHNLQSKSPLIDPMTSFLAKHIEAKGGSISGAVAEELCHKYHNKFIRHMTKRVDPELRPIHIEGKELQWNPSTGIVFDGDVAIGVFADGRMHDLQLKHMCICVSKGWNFKADGDYDSPFKV